MTKQTLFQQILDKKSYLCVGLDPDLDLLPKHLLRLDDPIFAFNKAIIDATADLCVAYKPNLAFYEALGTKGWIALEKTLDYIPTSHFTIADAKRGDIGNTSKKYATAFFEQMNFDAITVAPYMGVDSVQPFLSFEGKWVIVLALTSNTGSDNFQFLNTQDGKLFEQVLLQSQSWGNPENMMYVVGATHPQLFEQIRKIVPDHFLLVPGVGAQGGDLTTVSKYAINRECGLLVNTSRAILYASQGEDFTKQARNVALAIQQEMSTLLERYLVY
jgi:orotidine-5'-phosphate decarboxylase